MSMTIKDLMNRYGLKTRQSIYNWLKAAEIELEEDVEGRKVASDEQIQILDQVQEHLEEGGSLKTFTPLSNVELDSSLDTSEDSLVPGVYSLLDTPDTALMLKLVEILAQGQQLSPLQHHRELEEAESKKWILTTEEVETLIGSKPRADEQQIFQRGSWGFKKVGKIGRQGAWQVVRVNFS